MYACVRQLHGAYGAVRAEQPLAYPPSQRRALRFSKRTEHTVAERCGTVMVYLTKSQRDSRALFLALPCRNCGCGINDQHDTHWVADLTN